MDGERPDHALDLIRALSTDIGPRRPCSAEEKRAADMLERRLAERGVDVWREAFPGYGSFGLPYGLIMGVALAGGILQRSGRRLGDLRAVASLATASLEGDL